MVNVPLADFVKQIASDTAAATADRMMDLHMETVHPPLASRLMLLESRVDTLRMSTAKFIGFLTAATVMGGLSTGAILKLFGGL